MKRWSFLAPLFLFLAMTTWIAGQGCGSNNSPSSPAATNTPVPAAPTSTPTNSPTKTPTNTPGNTATNSPTKTPSNTATNSPTNTPSSTATDSPTDSPTSSPTDTGTPTFSPTFTSTPTDSPTGTSTYTPNNPPIYLTHYDFESSANGWAWDAGIAGATGGLSTAQANTGTGSIGVTFGAASGNENLRVDFPSPQNLTGMSLSFWIYVDTTAVNQISIFEQNTSYGFYEGGIYTTPNGDNLNHWVQYRYTFNGNGGSLAQVNDLDIQFVSTGTGAGHVYVDDIRIEPAPTTWTFEDGLTDAFNWGSFTGVTGQQLTATAPGGTGDSSSWALTMPNVNFSAQNQSAQMQYNFNPAANFTALGISTISCDVMYDAQISDNGSAGIQVYVQSGGSYHYESSGYNQPAVGTWQHVDFIPTWGGGGSQSDVKWIGVQFNTGGAGTAWGTANLKLDNVQLH